MSKHNHNLDHSPAWVFQTWISFFLSITATSLGIIYLPVNLWVKSFMGMGLAFTVHSTVSLTKTQRDLHESKKVVSKIEAAKVEKILSEHNI